MLKVNDLKIGMNIIGIRNAAIDNTFPYIIQGVIISKQGSIVHIDTYSSGFNEDSRDIYLNNNITKLLYL